MHPKELLDSLGHTFAHLSHEEREQLLFEFICLLAVIGPLVLTVEYIDNNYFLPRRINAEIRSVCERACDEGSMGAINKQCEQYWKEHATDETIKYCLDIASEKDHQLLFLKFLDMFGCKEDLIAEYKTAYDINEGTAVTDESLFDFYQAKEKNLPTVLYGAHYLIRASEYESARLPAEIVNNIVSFLPGYELSAKKQQDGMSRLDRTINTAQEHFAEIERCEIKEARDGDDTNCLDPDYAPKLSFV